LAKNRFLCIPHMALFITSLNSGSNGNCYYVGNHHEAVLVDVGISCREVEKRILRLGLNIRKIKAIFVSHEHSDHIRGITVLSKKYQLPVYITAATLRNCSLELEYHLIRPFKGYEAVTIGNLQVNAFPKFHDAAEPHSFVVECENVKVGVFTDIGVPCEHLIRHFKQCHAAFLEANYDEQMLATGHYPYHLKRRISGGHGHLSNRQALELFKTHKPLFMSHLLLSHLSKDNNCPNLAGELFNAHAGGTQIIVASRYEESPVFHIRAESVVHNQLSSSFDIQQHAQYSLF
jgi:phosphoribosyl 1,2-cyclic phosphodiesterase